MDINKKQQFSAIDNTDKNLSSLLKAQELQSKAAKVGFEWDNISDILDKLDEEIIEMRTAIKNNDIENQAEELGDILFLLANYGRNLGINSDKALNQCNNKFERRFRGLELELKKQNIDINDASLKQMEDGWLAQKLKEKN